MSEQPTCTCLSISRDPLCVFHGDVDKVAALKPAPVVAEVRLHWFVERIHPDVKGHIQVHACVTETEAIQKRDEWLAEGPELSPHYWQHPRDMQTQFVAEVRRAPLDITAIQRRHALALDDGSKGVRWELIREDMPALFAEVSDLKRGQATLVRALDASEAAIEALRTRLRGLPQGIRDADDQQTLLDIADELARLLTTPEEPKV